MKYIILGAGWYGNFIGLLFKILNIEFIILEKKNDIFTGSSSKNQNRLHQGYHYPRSHDTRDECVFGYNIFMRLFKFMIRDVKNNYYLLDKNSNILYRDYVKLYNNMNFECVNHITDSNIKLNMENIDGIIKCNEKLINHNFAYKFFKDLLIGETILNYAQHKLIVNDTEIIYDGNKYDYLINCTYGQVLNNNLVNNNLVNNIIDYELCISFIYSGNIDCALTLMDGPFFSIYPYITDIKSNCYTLTDVEYTPIKKSNNFDDILLFNIDDEIIMDTKLKMETKAKKYLTNFDEVFKYESYNISYKCKFNNYNDDRSVRFSKHKNIYSFVGGKITGIFGMAKTLFGELYSEEILENAYKIIESDEFYNKYIKDNYNI